jgi:hypothetical protein
MLRVGRVGARVAASRSLTRFAAPMSSAAGKESVSSLAARVNLKDKIVLVRADLNVPMTKVRLLHVHAHNCACWVVLACARICDPVMRHASPLLLQAAVAVSHSRPPPHTTHTHRKQHTYHTPPPCDRVRVRAYS